MSDFSNQRLLSMERGIVHGICFPPLLLIFITSKYRAKARKDSEKANGMEIEMRKR
jgi:hypothetical protein